MGPLKRPALKPHGVMPNCCSVESCLIRPAKHKYPSKFKTEENLIKILEAPTRNLQLHLPMFLLQAFLRFFFTPLEVAVIQNVCPQNLNVEDAYNSQDLHTTGRYTRKMDCNATSEQSRCGRIYSQPFPISVPAAT